jgi:hypothetical protein
VTIWVIAWVVFDSRSSLLYRIHCGLGGLLLLERLSSLSRIRLAMYNFNGGGRHNKEKRGVCRLELISI